MYVNNLCYNKALHIIDTHVLKVYSKIFLVKMYNYVFAKNSTCAVGSFSACTYYILHIFHKNCQNIEIGHL